MGNQQSTASAVSDVVNKSVTNVLLNTSSSCKQSNTSVQKLDFSNITAGEGCSLNFNNISQTSTQTPNFSCSNSASNEQNLLNQFKTQLDQQAQSTVAGLAGALNSQSSSEIVNNLKNKIENNINISSVSQCVQDNIAKQKQNYNKIVASCPGYCRNLQQCVGVDPKLCDMSKCSTNFSNISQAITQAAVGQCMSSNTNVTKAINDASNQISQIAKSENKGIDFAALFASLGVWFLPLIICVVLFCSSMFGSIAASMMGEGGQGAGPGMPSGQGMSDMAGNVANFGSQLSNLPGPLGKFGKLAGAFSKFK
jgi:hypothetical protein